MYLVYICQGYVICSTVYKGQLPVKVTYQNHPYWKYWYVSYIMYQVKSNMNVHKIVQKIVIHQITIWAVVSSTAKHTHSTEQEVEFVRAGQPFGREQHMPLAHPAITPQCCPPSRTRVTVIYQLQLQCHSVPQSGSRVPLQIANYHSQFPPHRHRNQVTSPEY